MELIKGRPADETGRLEKEIRVYDLLDKLGMEYYRTDCKTNFSPLPNITRNLPKPTILYQLRYCVCLFPNFLLINDSLLPAKTYYLH